jgi:flagellar biosynthetic protein FliR
MLAMMILFYTDTHHALILVMQSTLSEVPLGGFVMTSDVLGYILEAMSNMFIMGLTIAFPFLALSLLMDIIFGMLMKTMPQFNLLVIGFPIKIAAGFAVLMAILASIMLIFKQQFDQAINDLPILFG